MNYAIDNTDGYSLEGGWCNLVWEAAPTQPGYYWAKDKKGAKQIVEVRESNGKFWVWSIGFDYDCETSAFVAWLGPIPEPIG